MHGSSSQFSLWHAAEKESALDESKTAFFNQYLYIIEIFSGIKISPMHYCTHKACVVFISCLYFSGSVGNIPFDAPLEEFHSKKVMNKLIQQIHDPVVLASGALPEWTHQLTTSSPFLFPFEARELFFHCTAFGTSRYSTAL